MSSLYASVRHQLVTGGFVWTAGAYQAALVSDGYTPDFEAHTTWTDVPAANRLTPLLAMTEIAEQDGYCRGADLVWANLTTVGIKALVVSRVMDTDPEHNQLVAYLDEGDGFGLEARAVPVFVFFDPAGIWRP